MSRGHDYDAVIVGGGLGGLSAAARLARAGLRVLLVEAHDQPGGYASTFERGGFTFEVSLHLIDAVGPGQPNRPMLDDLGLGDRVTFLEPSCLRREIWPAHDLRLPRGMAHYVDLFAAHFPKDKAGLAALADLARRVHDEFHAREAEADTWGWRSEPLAGPQGAWADPSLGFDSSSLLSPLGPLGRRTAGAVVDDHVHDRRLRASLELFAHGWLGLPLDELAAIPFLIPWYSYQEFGGSYPVGGSAALSRALCDVVREHGGEVRLSCAARRILVSRRRARGVELADGSVVTTRAVVSNASPQHTFGSLIERDAMDPRYLARIERMRPSVSCLKVWLGLAGALAGPSDYDLYLCPSVDPLPGNREDPSMSNLSVVVPGNLHAGLVPDGRAVISITMLIEPAAYAAAEAAQPGWKARAAATLVRRVEEQLFPGLRERMQVMEIAAPPTFMRFTGNPGGSIYGWSARVDQSGARRLGPVTPIDGLTLAGAWTTPGGGFSSVMRSGWRAAGRILGAARGRGPGASSAMGAP